MKYQNLAVLDLVLTLAVGLIAVTGTNSALAGGKVTKDGKSVSIVNQHQNVHIKQSSEQNAVNYNSQKGFFNKADQSNSQESTQSATVSQSCC
jgi:hypothetical protein